MLAVILVLLIIAVIVILVAYHPMGRACWEKVAGQYFSKYEKGANKAEQRRARCVHGDLIYAPYVLYGLHALADVSRILTDV